jgi:hypothetical protein
MIAPARHATVQSSTLSAFDTDEQDVGELVPGERIGPPLAGTAGKALRRLGLVLLITLAIGGLLLTDPASWLAQLRAGIAAVSPTADRRPGSLEPAALSVATPVPRTGAAPAAREPTLNASPATRETRAERSSGEIPAATQTPTAGRQTVAKAYEEPQTPVADPADPYQMRALAVGLHPGLSRVLLARLSAADYRNAGVAIKTAVAETPDGAVFVWPRQRKPGIAVFEIRFVPGAAPNCRRYVVSVAKDGWLTTALPMEKCTP